MSGPNDLILEPPYLGVDENLTLAPAAKPAADPQYLLYTSDAHDTTIVLGYDGVPSHRGDSLVGNAATVSTGVFPVDIQVGDSVGNLVLNDPNVTPTTVICWLYGQQDGHAHHREVPLTGELLRSFGNPLRSAQNNTITLTGQGLTTASGTLDGYGGRVLWADDFSTAPPIPGTIIDGMAATPGPGTWAAGVALSATSNITNQGNGTDGRAAQSSGVNPYPDEINLLIPQDLPLDNFRFISSWGAFWTDTPVGINNVISEGVVFRANAAGTIAYYFGWCASDQTWYLKRRDNTYVKVDLASSTTNQFPASPTGSFPSDYRTFCIDVVDNGTASVSIKVSIDGVSIINYTDSSANRILHSTVDRCGLVFQKSGAVVGCDSLSVQYQSLELVGQRAVVTAGDIPSLCQGIRLTTTVGTLTPLQGFAVGSPYLTIPPVPKLDATIVSYYSGGAYNPGYIRQAFQPRFGKYEIAGEAFTWNANPIGVRIWGITADPKTHDWASYGGAAADTLDYAYGDTHFPRNGIENASTPLFNSSPSYRATLFSVDPDGGLHVLSTRQLSTNYNEINCGWQCYSLSSNYEGPELKIGIGYEPMGVYGWASERAVAFYPKNAPGNTNRLLLSAPSGTDTTIVLTGISSTVPAFRTAVRHDAEWSDEVVLHSASGGNHINVSPDHGTFIPSGVDGLFYFTYLSTEPDGSFYIGLAVIDARTREVYANTLTPAIGQVGSYPVGIYSALTTGLTWGERSVAEVARLGNGTNVTQFLLHGFVVNVQWESSDPYTPRLVIKSRGLLDTGFESRWESMEIRGDLVYHVLFSGAEGWEEVSHVYINDVVNTNDWGWTKIATTGTGGTIINGSRVLKTLDRLSNPVGGGDYFSGYGAGLDSFFYISRREPYADPVGASVKVWMQFWDQQPAFPSVSANLRVGQVRVSITPNVALTGLSVTAAQGDFDKIASGPDITKKIAGRKATATANKIVLPSVTFIIDTFTDTTGTHLDTHIGDTGHTWVTNPANQLQINGNVLDTIIDGAFSVALASAQAAKPDYLARATFQLYTSGSHISGQPEQAIGVRMQADYLNGYLWGANDVEGKLYLMKPNSHGESMVLFTVNVGPGHTSGTYELEVNGTNPTRLTGRLNGQDVIILDDYGYQYGTGYVGIRFDGFSAYAGYADNLNALYYVPDVCIPDGQRAYVTGGILTGPWPTGQRATTAQGALTASVGGSGDKTVELTGLAETASAGTIDDVISMELTGQAATTDFGTLVPSTTGDISVELFGQMVVALYHNMEPATRPLVGLRATCVRGLLAPEISFVLSGGSSTAATGVVTPIGGVTFTGLSATTTAGVAVAAPGATPPSLTATLLGGYLTETIDNFGVLSGNAATATQGVLTPVTAEGSTPLGRVASITGGVLTGVVTTLVPLVGSTATSSAGALSVSIACAMTGAGCAMTQQALSTLISKTLASGVCTAVQGVLGYTYSCTLFVSGLQMHISVGDVTGHFPKIKPDMMLWAQAEVKKLFIQSDPDEEFPVVTINQ